MKHKQPFIYLRLLVVAILTLPVLLIAVPVYATVTGSTGGSGSSGTTQPNNTVNLDNTKTKHQCGSGDGAVGTTINFGCKGESCLSSKPDATYCAGNNSGILDVTFAIIRFLSIGVGLVVVGSMVVAGIQYTTSRGDPKATAEAETRIKATVIALLIYIFAYAILNYVLPKGFLK